MKGVVLLALILAVSGYSNVLDYESQDQWTDGWDAATCNEGTEQSPIDVERPEYSMEMRESFDSWNEFETPWQMLYASGANNSLKWVFDEPLYADVPTVDSMQLYQLHFHWSEDDHTGSEHAMEGERFAAEMHLVTRRYTEAYEYSVVNRFFEVVSDDEIEAKDWAVYEEMEKMLDDSMWTADRTNHIVNISIANFFQDVTEYLRYNGSFTTPDCDEEVDWVIIPKPLKMSQSQMERMRSYRYEGDDSNDFVRNNVRNLQPVNDREMKWYVSDDHVDEDAESHDNEEDAREHLECRDGEGVMWMENEDHWACGWCSRGWFGWKNRCHACPPGKSTVNTGSAFRDCIDTRYISCKMHDTSNGYSMGEEEMESGMVCEREFCPCNNNYEECEYDEYSEEYGMCRQAYHGGAGGVTVTASLVAACLAYFGL